MRVIVAGSRDITDSEYIFKCIEDAQLPITEVVSGTARGVDTFGEIWALAEHIPYKQFFPNWDKHGKAAGYIRNKEMGEYADALVAIWDGKSRGTKHMIDIMEGLEKPVYLYVR